MIQSIDDVFKIRRETETDIPMPRGPPSTSITVRETVFKLKENQSI